MLKGKKTSEEEVQPLSRIILPRETGIRPLSGIKDLLATAESSPGQQVESGWTSSIPGQSFVLDVQWDGSTNEPIWSLYEENEGQSKQVWSQSFAIGDIELAYDVLVMSCGAAATPGNKLSDIIKSRAAQDKEARAKHHAGPISAEPENANSPSNSESEYSLNINPEAPDSIPSPSTATTPAGPPANTAQPITAPSNPNYVNQPGTVFPPNFPPSPYNMPPGVIPPVFPVVYPPVMPAGQGYAAQPVWPFPPFTTDSTGTPTMPVNPYVQQPIAPTNRPTAEPLSTMPIDTSLVNKRYDVSLADLLKRAELLSESSLAAASKIQNLVQTGKLADDKAAAILKQHHKKGEAIENYIGADNPVSAISAQIDKTTPGPTSNTNSPSTSKEKPLSKEKSAAFELLEKAGILSKDDIMTAKNVSRKHGGDLVSILKAAQKLDDKTFEAALICVAVLSDERMKLEQCIIALNYCSRSRVSFDEALADLNWENPIK